MNQPPDSGLLSPTAAVKVSYTVSERLGEDRVSVSVTFSSNGLRRLPPDGSLAVNGQVLSPKRLAKQGWWYEERLNAAPRYSLHVERGNGAPAMSFLLHAIPFNPVLPETLSRRLPIVIPYEGGGASGDLEVFVRLRSVDGVAVRDRWQVIVNAALENNRIVLPASELAKVRSGSALLYVGAAVQQREPTSKHDISYAVGREGSVRIMD